MTKDDAKKAYGEGVQHMRRAKALFEGVCHGLPSGDPWRLEASRHADALDRVLEGESDD